MNIMAEEKKDDATIPKGSEHVVTVEESSQDALIVRLEYSGLLYRGALLNITNRDVPSGVNPVRLKPEIWKPNWSSQPQTEGKKPIEDSSVVNRFTYRSEPVQPIIIQSNGQPPGKAAKTSYKNKTVRNIRLRPRQVLCANCKSSCTEKTIVPKVDAPKVASTDRATRSSSRISLPPSKPMKMSLKKPDSSASSRMNNSNSNRSVLHKSSPVIKISFNTPEGQGTIVKIPSKSQSDGISDSEHEEKLEQIPIGGNKKLKKSLRKAKEKLQPYDLQSKHGKHRKHKHKHEKKIMEALNPVVALSPLQLENYHDGNEENISEQQQVENDSAVENPYRSPLRTKVVMKRERTASGTMNYVYKAHRISASQSGEKSSLCSKNLTISLCRVDEDQEEVEKSDSETVHEHVNHQNNGENIEPLLMRIQTKSVNKVMLEDQRTICAGDIVWGKIHGFPWWPAKVLSIQISQKDDGVIIYQQAQVSWFGSSTMSDMPCAELFPFLEDFEMKFNKKKRGPYRVAIKQATVEAQGLLGISEPNKTDSKTMSEVDHDADVETVACEDSVSVSSSLVVTSSSGTVTTTPPLSPATSLSDIHGGLTPPAASTVGSYSPMTSSASPLMTSSLYSPNVTPFGFSNVTPSHTDRYPPAITALGHTSLKTPIYSPKYSPIMTSYSHSPNVTSSISPSFMTYGHSTMTSPVYSSLPSSMHSLLVTSPVHSPVSRPQSPIMTSYTTYSPIVSPISSYEGSPAHSPISDPGSLTSPTMASPVQCV